MDLVLPLLREEQLEQKAMVVIIVFEIHDAPLFQGKQCAEYIIIIVEKYFIMLIWVR